MKRIINTMLLTSFVTLLFFQNSLLAQGGSRRYSLAVLSLAGETSSLDRTDLRFLTGELTREVSNTGKFVTMSQVAMEDGLMNNGFDPDQGCGEPGCASRAAKALGVQLVIFGEIGPSVSGFTLEAKLMHVASGEVVKSNFRDIYGGFEEVLDQMPQFASDLLGSRNNQPSAPPQGNYGRTDAGRSSTKPVQPRQRYQRSGGSKWLYVGLGALVAGGVGAGVLLLSGDDGGATNSGSSSPAGKLGGPPSFP